MVVPESDEVGRRILEEMFPGPRPTPLQANRIRALRKLPIPEGRDPVEYLIRHIMGSVANEFNVAEIDDATREAVQIAHEEGFGDKKKFLDMLDSTQNLLDSLTTVAHGAASAVGFATWGALSDFPHVGGAFSRHILDNVDPNTSPVAKNALVGLAAGFIGSLMDHSPGQAVGATFGHSYYTRPPEQLLNVGLAVMQRPASRLGIALQTGAAATTGYGGRNIALRLTGELAMIADGVKAPTRSLYDGICDTLGGPAAGAVLRMVSGAMEKVDGRSGVQYLLGRADFREMLQAYESHQQQPLKETARMVKERASDLTRQLRLTPLINNELFSASAWASHLILAGAFAQVLAADAVLKGRPSLRVVNHQLGLLPWYFLWGAALQAIGSLRERRPNLDQLVHQPPETAGEEAMLPVPEPRMAQAGVESFPGRAPVRMEPVPLDVPTLPRFERSEGSPSAASLRFRGEGSGRRVSYSSVGRGSRSGPASGLTPNLGDPGTEMQPVRTTLHSRSGSQQSGLGPAGAGSTRSGLTARHVSTSGSTPPQRPDSRSTARQTPPLEPADSRPGRSTTDRPQTPHAPSSLLQVPPRTGHSPGHRRASSKDSQAVSVEEPQPTDQEKEKED